MALRPTRRSGSTWSLAKAAPSGYRVNCSTPNTHDSATIAQYGSTIQPHISTGSSTSTAALKRIRPARLMRSDSQPIGHCDSNPAVTAAATKMADCDVDRPCLAA
ncbi:Uncharacterised protein [Bordetella pertussis]|nr:Uncharacterised protein [Bordetella pertussis]CFM17732.1 Uncharacterised protein [Bordetella pertussis]CFO36121.1 Uncharacterised protein [Bordetella pertussis]CFP09077.1 Uncharacterised protein [Bordetella pertussis]CFU07517.1 Uncharacterised protein [Bordetella pertussis]